MEEVEFNTLSKSVPEPAILIQNAYKRYTRKTTIFNGLSLTVPQGTVYALLGPSGCGKTTLLNCVTGITVLDSGTITLCVKRRSEVGYMPQFLCLYTQMTIFENFCVYGYLLGMSANDVKARSKELISFLELPDGNRFVSTLSGGQQRRVSIAVTFLHDPKILILDEPTVGLDPILSQSIWKRLLQMADAGRSIIITTHYIDEAKQAHTIGIMRNGKLLADDAPMQLIGKYNCNNLEDVFLQLSHKQENDQRNMEKIDYPQKKENVKVYYEDDYKIFSISKLKAITYKNITLIKREYLFLILLLVLPITQTFFCNISLGAKPRNLPIGVINEEISIHDCKYTTFDDCILNENNNFSLSCWYLQYIQSESYILIEYKDEATALRDMNKAKIRGLLHFAKNYTSSVVQRIIYARATSNEDFIASNVDIWVDSKDIHRKGTLRHNLIMLLVNSIIKIEHADIVHGMKDLTYSVNQNIAEYLNSRITQTRERYVEPKKYIDYFISSCIKYDASRYIQPVFERAMTNCELHPKSGIAVPVSFEKPVYGTAGANFAAQAAIAILCLCCFFLPTMMSGGLMFIEKAEGLIERMLVAGASILEIIVAVSIVQLVVHAVQAIEAMFITFVWYDNPLEGNIFVLSSLLLLIGFSGMCFGIMLGTLSKNITTTVYAGVGANIAMAFTTGISWPLEGAHYLLRSINWALPMTTPIDAARAVTLRNFYFTHPVVIMGFASCLGWSLIFAFIIFFVTKVKGNNWAIKK